jgi:mRNA interferase RelE/StbE
VFEIQIEKAAEKQLRKISEPMHERIVNAILPLAENPRPVGAKKLSGTMNDWRIRVGDYRVLYEIAEEIRIVRIFRVAHRRDVYR